MKIENKIRFSSAQDADVKQKLRYIDHVTEHCSMIDCPDNMIDTLLAAMMLEGYVLTSNEVKSVLEENSAASSVRNSSFIKAYHTILSEIFAKDVDMSFDESRIMALHGRLYGDNSKVEMNVAKRIGMTRLLGGNRSTLFTHRPTVVVSNEMRDLVEWFLSGHLQNDTHTLILIAAFLYEFMAIHPFREGKEELSHLLSLLLMRRAGCHWVAIYAPIREIAESRLEYHRAIKHGIINRYTENEDITEWIVYWIDKVYESAKKASAYAAPELKPVSASHKSYLNMRQRKILAFIDKNQPVKLSDIVKYLRKESINTVKKDLLRLREAGYVSTEGVLKGTVYFKC